MPNVSFPAEPKWANPLGPTGQATDADAWLILNYACDARCNFCHIEGLLPGHKSADLVRRQILEARSQCSGNRIGFSGGEPTLRRDLPDLIYFARSCGFNQVHLYTHGRKLRDGDYTKALVNAGLTSVQISVHGSSPDTHNALMGTPGGYDETWQGLEILSSLDVPITINTVATRDNLTELSDIYTKVMAASDHLSIIEYRITYPALQRAIINNKELAPSYGSVVEKVMPILTEHLSRRAATTPAIRTELIPLCYLGPYFYAAVEYKYRGQSDYVMDTNHSEVSRVWPKDCVECGVKYSCTGVQRRYLDLFDAPILRPTPQSLPEAHWS